MIFQSKAFDRQRLLANLLTRFLREHNIYITESTRTTYANHAKSLSRHLGHIQLGDICEENLYAYCGAMRQDGKAIQTTYQRLRFLKLAWKKAIVWHWINHDPFADFRFPKLPPDRVRMIEDDELEPLLHHMQMLYPWMVGMFWIARETGLRLSNLLDLRWKEVDLKRRSIRIEAIKLKNQKPLVIPMSDKVYAVLREQMHWRATRLKDLVFHWSLDGKTHKFNRFSVGQKFNRVCKKAGITNFTWHDLRHDFASVLISNGAPLEVVRDLCGHSSIASTLRYAHLKMRPKIDAIQIFNKSGEITP